METIFGTYTVLQPAEPKSGHVRVIVKCSCGADARTVRLSQLRRGEVKCACTRSARVTSTFTAGQIRTLKAWMLEIEGSIKGVQEGLELLQGFDARLRALEARKPDQASDAGTGAQPARAAGVTMRDLLRMNLTIGERIACSTGPVEDPFTKADVYAGHASHASALEQNLARMREIIATPYLDRSARLHQELSVRWLELTEQMHLIHPSEPAYAPLDAVNLAGRRVLDAWHIDPDDM